MQVIPLYARPMPLPHDTDRLVALALAWSRDLRMDEVSARLRGPAHGLRLPSNPTALRRAVGLRPDAPLAAALDVLAVRHPSPAEAARLRQAAEIAWERALP